MTSGRNDKRQQNKRKSRGKGKRRARGSLLTHPGFAPLLGLWGAVLGGLVTLVLPTPMVTTALADTGMRALGPMAQQVLAAAAGVLLGGVLFILAATISNRARTRAAQPTLVERAARAMRPIDPARDLGSRSLDEPFAAQAFDDAEMARALARHTAEPDLAPTPDCDPLALDLTEFPEMPTRPGHWGEPAGAAPTLATGPALRHAAPPVSGPAADPGTGALALLRATPTEDLSLVQLVERFAAALQDHRAAVPGTPGHNRDLAARDAALAEALKALAALSSSVEPRARKEPLEEALTRLQALRGAA